MKKNIFSLLIIVLVTSMIISPASAGGNVGLGSVAFKPGSLIATGVFFGLGGYKLGVNVQMTAGGDPVVLCTNKGGTQAPGQNPVEVSADGEQAIGPQHITKKGTAPLDVTAEPGPITGLQGGCPNNNWIATIVNVYWTNATISVYDAVTGELLFERNYACDPDKQTATSVTCEEVN